MIVFALHHLKGGVGKTTSAVNLAWLSARAGFRTLLIDLDPQGASSFLLDCAPWEKKGARKWLRGRCELAEQARPTEHEFLEVVAADDSLRHFDRWLDARREGSSGAQLLRERWASLAEAYDHVFLDCPPGLTPLAAAVVGSIDVLLAPTIPTPLALRALAREMRWLREVGERAPRVLPFFTLVDARKSLHRDTLAWAASQPLGFLAARVPYSSSVERMGVRRAPLCAFERTAPASLAYEDLWAEIERLLEIGARRRVARPRLVPGRAEDDDAPHAPQSPGRGLAQGDRSP